MALLVFLSMLSSTMVIPAVRPFIAQVHGGGQHLMHAFMGINMLGALIGAPLLALLADRTGARRRLAAAMCLADAVLLGVCSLPIPTPMLLVVRCLEGAANVGALSVLMGLAGSAGGDRALHGRALGMAGAAVMAAVALGSPLGTMFMAVDVSMPLSAGAVVSLVAAVGCMRLLPLSGPRPAPRASLLTLLRPHPQLWVPTAWVAAERFTIGCFVVTFALYCHRVLGLSDERIGILYSWFLLPFALATYPVGRLAEHVNRAALVAAGGLVYGLSFIMLGLVDAGALVPVLLLAGLSSAVVYACSLCFAASLVDASLRSTSMGLLNAGGSVAMFLGTACAGVLLGVLPRLGIAEADVYPTVFWFAAACQLTIMACTAPALCRLAVQDEPIGRTEAGRAAQPQP